MKPFVSHDPCGVAIGVTLYGSDICVVLVMLYNQWCYTCHLVAASGVIRFMCVKPVELYVSHGVVSGFTQFMWCSQWWHTIHGVQPVEFHLLMWSSEWCFTFHVGQPLAFSFFFMWFSEWCCTFYMMQPGVFHVVQRVVLHVLRVQPVELHVSHGVVSGFTRFMCCSKLSCTFSVAQPVILYVICCANCGVARFTLCRL